MRISLLVATCVLVSGCSAFRTAEVAPKPQPIVEVTKNDCYTVDLFTKVDIEKVEAGAPAGSEQFLGEWGGGAWNDVWCHGLLINKVYADGRVELVDMHAPYEPWAQPATAFRRIGRIDEKGTLRFAHGTSRLSYRIENGKLIGSNNGQYGDLTVELARIGGQPAPIQLSKTSAVNPVQLSHIPAPNPLRLSQLGMVMKSGS